MLLEGESVEIVYYTNTTLRSYCIVQSHPDFLLADIHEFRVSHVIIECVVYEKERRFGAISGSLFHLLFAQDRGIFTHIFTTQIIIRARYFVPQFSECL